MRKANRIIKRIGRTTIGLSALLACSFFAACTEDTYLPDTVTNGDEAVVMLAISTPRPSTPSPLSRVQTDTETNISKVRVLVFEYVDGQYIFSYHVAGTEVGPSDIRQTRFKALLRARENVQMKLMILANVEHAFMLSAPAPGATEAAVRTMINASFTDAGVTGDLPMYGEIILPDGLSPTSTHVLAVTVLRAVARVDVETALSVDTQAFTLEEVYAFRSYDKIQVIPDALLAASTTPKVNAPSIPVGAALLNSPIVKISSSGESITQLYIPESAAAETDTEKLTGTTTIVVGGRFGGEGYPVTYYRADFDSGVEGHPFGQVLRNYRYVFRIKSVSSPGWSTPEEAAVNLSASILINVQAWEDFSTEMYWNNNRFAISSREISMPYVAGRTRRLDVESTLRYKIQWLDGNGDPAGLATSELNTTISNDDFDVTIVQDAGDPEHTTHLSVHTLHDNYNGDILTGRLLVTADAWEAEVTVSQDNTALYSNRNFNILTVATIGNLGTTGDPATASGLAMRWLLDVQFAPDGMVKIAGFNYNRVENNVYYAGATPTETPLGWANIQRVISRQDVIYLPYDVRLSTHVASLILSWLAADTRRVLIVETDSRHSSANLLSSLTDDGTWLFDIATVSTKYSRAAYTPGVEPFFNGPFGTVAPNAAFNRSDGVAGYNNTYATSGNVIPLIMGDKDPSRAMVFGINPSRRIVYHGDGHLFLSPQMSNNTGTVSTDADKLMANLWAWITVQLIYGDD